jgi:hypothetical protein
MEQTSGYLITVSIEQTIENIIANAQKQVNKEMLDQIELSKTYVRDKQRITGLVTLLHEALRIFKTAKNKIENEWLNSLNARTLSAGYDKRINDAIDCLRKKEYLVKSLEDVEKDIKTNEDILDDIRQYYEARKKRLRGDDNG